MPMKKVTNHRSKCPRKRRLHEQARKSNFQNPEAFDFEEFGASLESRESTRGNELRQTVSRDSHLRQTLSRDSQLTAVDLSPQQQRHSCRNREMSPRQPSRDNLSPQPSRERRLSLPRDRRPTNPRETEDYSATINSVTNLQQDGKLEQAHNLMATVVTRSDLGWVSQNNEPGHVTPLLTLTLMYGLSLRHGWGGEKDETRAFRYICGAAVGLCHVSLTMLNKDTSESDKKTQMLHRSAMKTALSSLAQSLYELGNCYHYGWGLLFVLLLHRSTMNVEHGWETKMLKNSVVDCWVNLTSSKKRNSVPTG